MEKLENVSKTIFSGDLTTDGIIETEMYCYGNGIQFFPKLEMIVSRGYFENFCTFRLVTLFVVVLEGGL